jgi:hypothetical protein
MSSTDTKWKKKVKGINRTEELEDKKEGLKTRGEKDKAQTKMLDELKNRLRNIKNKRNGFTKLPHLTDIKDESDDKEEFNEGAKNDDKEEFSEGAKNDNKEEFKEGAKNNEKYPHGVTLILSYIVFLITYLQLYHLNFKESIKSNFPDIEQTSDNNVNPENDDNIPREWSAITENILDSLTKTLGGWVRDPEYVDIKHNEFLKYMNYIARFDFGIFLRYLFIPAQVIVAITQNLIPNLKLIPGINKLTFPLIFVFLFLCFYGATFTNKIDGVSEIRNKGKDGNGEWWDWIVKYYAIIPISYFVIVGIIIIGAFSLDTFKQMGDGTYFKDGFFAAIAKTLFKLFTLSMSIVLSGLAAIPLGIYALLWILVPEGIGIPPGKYEGFTSMFDFIGLTKWSKTIRDNYLLPEWDVCEESNIKQWARYIVRKLWNNKILISFFIVADISTKLYLGNGDFQNGKEEFNSGPWYGQVIRYVFPIFVLLVMMGQPATRERGIDKYIPSFIEYWGGKWVWLIVVVPVLAIIIASIAGIIASIAEEARAKTETAVAAAVAAAMK